MEKQLAHSKERIVGLSISIKYVTGTVVISKHSKYFIYELD